MDDIHSPWPPADNDDPNDDVEPIFCVKTRELNSGKKFFINFTCNNSLPGPSIDWDELQLKRVIESESSQLDEYLIPMISTPLYNTCDNKGDEDHFVTDLLVNRDFVNKRVLTSPTHKSYMIVSGIALVQSKFNDPECKSIRAKMPTDKQLKLDIKNLTVLKYKKTQLGIIDLTLKPKT